MTLTAVKPLASAGAVSQGSAFAINDSGTIVGYEQMASSKGYGLKWTNMGTASSPRWRSPVRLTLPSSLADLNGTTIDAGGDVGGFGEHGKYSIATIVTGTAVALKLRALQPHQRLEPLHDPADSRPPNVPVPLSVKVIASPMERD